MQNIDKIKEMIRKFSTLRNEFDNLSDQKHQINKRLNEIETEMSEIRNYLYHDRPQNFIQDVSDTLDKVIREDATEENRNALKELKEIIELWLNDYTYLTRYGTDHLSPHKRKKSSDKNES
ncbi:MAG TPA: hypothetical protein VEF33_13125 [Syntrophales bacterium]|nr:hypothetical protein [Syntrophales bacterium]